MGIIKEALNSMDLKIKVRAAMPGHKGKIKVEGSHDVTELPELDNLQDPQGILKRAEAAAAQLYGTAQARFLVNGSTAGNLAMIFSFFSEGDRVLIERNCHKSLYNAMLLRKLEPCYLWPEFDEYNNSLPQSPKAVQNALEQYPGIKGIVLTQPSYKGCFSDFKAIAAIAADHGVHLLLDAAHGAAMVGMPDFTDFYTSCSAMVVSTHKSLGCLNQGAILLLNRPEFAAKILKYTNMFTTTSPSYLILESIESSLEDLAAGLYLYAPEFAGADYANLVLNPVSPGLKQDPWKLLIYSKENGDFMESFLEANGVYPELHDPDSVLLMLSPFNPAVEIDYLKEVLAKLDAAPELAEKKIAETVPSDQAPQSGGGMSTRRFSFPKPPKTMMLPYLAGDDYIEVELDQAVGHIVQEPVIPYPPGVPLLVSGEVVELEMVAYIEKLKAENVAILGLYNNKLRCLRKGN